jgi:hypothetical protein
MGRRAAECVALAMVLGLGLGLGGCQILDPGGGISRGSSRAPIAGISEGAKDEREPTSGPAVTGALAVPDEGAAGGAAGDGADASVGDGAREDSTETYIEVAPASSGRLHVRVENAMGAVQVVERGGLERPRVYVDRIDANAEVGPDRRRRVPTSFRAAVTRREGGGDQVLEVSCGEEPGPVRIRVEVVSLGDVVVRNAGGPVAVRGVEGSVDVANGTATVGGDSVTVETSAALTGPVTIGTDRGSVLLRVARGSTGVLGIRGQASRVAVDARHDTMSRVRTGEGTYTGVLNDGEALWRVSAPGPVTVKID